MNRNLLGFVVGALAVLILILAGCGAGAAPSPAPQVSRQVAPSAPAPVAAPTRAAAASESLGAGAADSAANVIDRLIIRNGSMTIIVKDVSETVTKIADIANAAKGVVMRTDMRRQNDALIATVTIKVPAEAFDDVMAQLRKLAVKVDVDNTSSQDVTEEYVDLDARLKVYEATEQQLMTFLQKTQNVDESLKVYRELNNVRSQIESLKGRMNYLKQSAAMSNITISVRPEEKEKPIIEEEGWDPLRVVRDALRSLVTSMQGLINLLIYFVITVLPVLIVVAILFVIARSIWRRLRRPKKS